MGSQSFHRKVSIPAVVMLGTVVTLGGLGYLLSGINSSSASTAQTSELDTSSLSGRQLSVVVLNGTKTAGLARDVSGVLASRGWTIKQVGNWSETTLAQSTIFYPPGAEKSAQALAKEVGAVIAPTQRDLSQVSLTYVIMK